MLSTADQLASVVGKIFQSEADSSVKERALRDLVIVAHTLGSAEAHSEAIFEALSTSSYPDPGAVARAAVEAADSVRRSLEEAGKHAAAHEVRLAVDAVREAVRLA